MKKVNTSINIQSKPEKIWKILTKFEEYPIWNPFITSITGKAEKNATLTVSLNGMIFKPKVITLIKNEKFQWKGQLLFPGLFDGQHSFQIRQEGENCIFIHSEHFSGILTWFFKKSFFEKLQQDFEAMNEALKVQAEEN